MAENERVAAWPRTRMKDICNLRRAKQEVKWRAPSYVCKEFGNFKLPSSKQNTKLSQNGCANPTPHVKWEMAKAEITQLETFIIYQFSPQSCFCGPRQYFSGAANILSQKGCRLSIRWTHSRSTMTRIMRDKKVGENSSVGDDRTVALFSSCSTERGKVIGLRWRESWINLMSQRKFGKVVCSCTLEPTRVHATIPKPVWDIR